MMAVKSYFRAPRLHGRRKQQQQPMIDSGGEESPSAALLGAAAADELSAAAVPKGCFAVYVGAAADEARRRFVVPTSYLRQPAFRDLMERAAEEFGFAQAAGIRIPCRAEDFQATVAALQAAAPRAGRVGTLTDTWPNGNNFQRCLQF